MEFYPKSYAELCRYITYVTTDLALRMMGGQLFEYYIARCLRYNGYEVKRNKEIARELKSQYQIPKHGEGIDGIFKKPEETNWHPYQVKFTSKHISDHCLTKFYKHAPILIDHGMAKPAYVITNDFITDSTFYATNTVYGW